MRQLLSDRRKTDCFRPACSRRQQLIAAFSITARIYGDAVQRWQGESAAADVSAYRDAEIARQDAWIEYQIARLVLRKHAEGHRCEPVN